MPNLYRDYKSAPVARLRDVNANGNMAFGLPVGISRALRATGYEYYSIEFVPEGVLLKPIKLAAVGEIHAEYPDWMKEGPDAAADHTRD